MVRPLMRVWIPLVLVVLAALSGFTSYRMHGVFGSQGANAVGAGGGGDDQTMPLHPKRVPHEVFVLVGTVGSISYLDENARREGADFGHDAQVFCSVMAA
ncbi:MAG TPA: MmpS family transport accessory protein [Mycobacterium sp.]|nr:MmpS family transport accessory protein [Mycobacterium sp.]